MIAKGAGIPITLSFIPSVLTAVVSFFKPTLILLSALLLMIPAFTLFFFRDPDRETAEGIVSPADGRIVELDRERRSLDIFMSLTDVHVNRTPIPGRIISSEHVEGKCHPAYSEKSSENERREIQISTESGVIIVHQIAGIFARRIVSYVDEGDRVQKGERIGMIRFGSRVHLELPSDTRLTVKEGERVKAGETRVGTWI